jgi:hypothetical protein
MKLFSTKNASPETKFVVKAIHQIGTTQMAGTSIFNNSTIILNIALCITNKFFEANKINPGYGGKWDKTGPFYYNIVTVPWYGPRSEFGQCQLVYHEYMKRIPELAKQLSESGKIELEYVTVIGRDLDEKDAEDRLKGLAYSVKGKHVAGKNIVISGGPQGPAVEDEGNHQTIDISDEYEFANISVDLVKRQEDEDDDDGEDDDEDEDDEDEEEEEENHGEVEGDDDSDEEDLF